MADEDDEAEDNEDGLDEEGEGKVGESKPRSRKKLIVMAGAGFLMLAGVGGGVAWYLGLLGADGTSAPEKEIVAQKPAVFFELPDITVNLASLDQRSQYLRIKVALEVSDRDAISSISPMLPRVMDTFQVYLRELRLTDLEGSAGIYRLKEELRRRVNLAVYPAQVNDVLFKELLIQ